MPWYRELNRYHWFVLIVAALGWLFDCFDQQLFILARQPAMKDLLHISDPDVLKAAVDAYSGYATSIFLIGWAPDDSQPKPLRPGSASARLADALNVPENPLKD